MLISRLRPGFVVQPDAASALLRYGLPGYVPARVLTLLPILPLDRRLSIPLVHSDDLADGIARVIERRAGGAFNFAGEPPITRDDIAAALGAGKIKVNYHALNILDERSDPAGYSTLAANAALCAVPAGIWPAYHDKLFAEQPAEGGPGLTVERLTALGTELGAGPEFGSCVAATARAGAITAATASASADPALQTDGQFGTPTVAVGGRKIDVSDDDWVDGVVGGR